MPFIQNLDGYEAPQGSSDPELPDFRFDLVCLPSLGAGAASNTGRFQKGLP